ncbi:MAG: hypothetical protein ACOYD3_06055, partial [Kiritimatiellia bacterium]
MNNRRKLGRQPEWFSARGKKTLGRLSCAFLLGCVLLAGFAAASPAPPVPGSDDPNFVKASLLIIGPGDASLFSRFGHASLRMECPRHNLDRCFSYEGDDVSARPLMFLLGRLKMGMASVPTAIFLEDHRRDGRSIVQHELNLPVAVKQELWRVLDNHVAAGMTVPYDAVKRGCSRVVLDCLKAATAPVGLQYGAWPRFARMTIRERILEALSPHPWHQFIVNGIYGSVSDGDGVYEKRLALPEDLLEVFRRARYLGRPLLAGEAIELTPQTRTLDAPVITPMAVAFAFMFLAIINVFARCRVATFGLLSVQFVLGSLLLGLFIFNRTAMGWNWLLVPINPLPLLAWRFRGFWLIPAVVVLCLWCGGMSAAPHRLTYAPCYVLVLSFAILFAGEAYRLNIGSRGSCKTLSDTSRQACIWEIFCWIFDDAAGCRRTTGRNRAF